MIFWILTSCLALSAGPTAQSRPDFRVALTKRQEQLIHFDLDLGWARILGVQASLNPEFLSVRLPASISKSGQSYPELDFSNPQGRGQVLQEVQALIDQGNQTGSPREMLERSKKKSRDLPNQIRMPSLRVVSLGSVKSKRGLKVAQGEIWFDEWLAVRFKLMRSKWSASPKDWWIAWPSAWDETSKTWQDLFAITNRDFKEKILDLVREAYSERERRSNNDE